VDISAAWHLASGYVGKKREFAIFEYLGRNDLFENSISVQLSKLADFLLGRIDLQ
jgi:hypothetical protein